METCPNPPRHAMPSQKFARPRVCAGIDRGRSTFQKTGPGSPDGTDMQSSIVLSNLVVWRARHQRPSCAAKRRLCISRVPRGSLGIWRTGADAIARPDHPFQPATGETLDDSIRYYRHSELLFPLHRSFAGPSQATTPRGKSAMKTLSLAISAGRNS